MLKNIDKKSAVKLAVGVVATVAASIVVAVAFNKGIPVPTNKLGQIAWSLGKGIAIVAAVNITNNEVDKLVDNLFESHEEINKVEAA